MTDDEPRRGPGRPPAPATVGAIERSTRDLARKIVELEVRMAALERKVDAASAALEQETGRRVG